MEANPLHPNFQALYEKSPDFSFSALIASVRAKTGLKVTKNFFPEYSRPGTRAAGKTYDKPWHNLSQVEEG